jgi:DNA (cytosine-5)-methyltransferase 1
MQGSSGSGGWRVGADEAAAGHIVAHTLRAEGADASEDGTGRGTPLTIAFEPRYARNGRGAPDTVVPPLKAQSGQTGKGDGAACVAFSNRMGGAAGVTVTLRADSHGALPMDHRQRTGVRRLTPVECERLQGFPDDWTRWAADGSEISDSARYRMLGNAVTVSVAEWVGRRIMEAAS